MPTTADQMVRAARRPRRAARAVTLLFAGGLALSACSQGTDADPHAGHGEGHNQAAANTSAPARPDPDTATSTEPAAGDEGHDPHAHHGGQVEEVAPTTGPPRPADTELDCGTTILADAEQIIRYCDTGHATLALGDQQAEVEGAQCEDRGMFFLAHFGTNYSDEAAARGEYLGLVLEELPDQGTGSPRISALELTFQGYRQAVTEAEVDVEVNDTEVSLTLTGALQDGEDLRIEAHCEVG